jgi:hypothetical protein
MVKEHSRHGISSPLEGGPGGPCLAWAWMDVMELAGRLAQQHAQELKEMLRLEGDRVNQARPSSRRSPKPSTTSSAPAARGRMRGEALGRRQWRRQGMRSHLRR